VTTLLQRYANVMEQLEALRDARLDLEGEIINSMDRDGATEWVVGPYTATLKRTTTYVQDKLTPILELIPESDLVAGKAYIPEHQVPVAAKFNLTKLKPFARRGAAVRDVIEAASIQGAPKLKVEVEKEKE
jgi:hypothetical protein